MKELPVRKNAEGQRLMAFLSKALPKASSSFLYRMLRKKNITLNESKATGSERLREGDLVKVFFSDETFLKFSGADTDPLERFRDLSYDPVILYEDRDLLVVHKPSGILSQGDGSNDPSMNDLLLSFLIRERGFRESDYRSVHPSVIDRLDRNTSGILLFGKTIKGLQEGSDLMQSHGGDKTYHAIVKGPLGWKVGEKKTLKGFLTWDEGRRMMRESKTVREGGISYEETLTLLSDGPLALLEIGLFTGRKHQIRASLKAGGHPVAGDRKYGGPALPGLGREMGLHAYSIEIRPGVRVTDPDPAWFSMVLKGPNRKDLKKKGKE